MFDTIVSEKASPDSCPLLTSTFEDLDKALENHIISTRLAHDVHGCASSCFATVNCVSFNFQYRARGQKICELNSSTKKLSKASFVKRVGFVYYG